MNWKIILLLSLFGLLMGILSLLGWTQRIELLLWAVIGVVTVFVLLKNVDQKFFLYGLLVGVIDGLWNGIVQAVFFSTYVTNNPEFTKAFEQSGITPSSIFVLISGLLTGLLYGVVLGLAAWLFGKRKKGEGSAASPPQP